MVGVLGKKVVAALAVAGGVLLVSPSARADSGQCADGTLVETGDSMEHVLAKCGEPVRRVVRDEASEDWVYDPGWGSCKRVLRFHFGVLEAIRVRGCG
jgi:hypothetical protein